MCRVPITEPEEILAYRSNPYLSGLKDQSDGRPLKLIRIRQGDPETGIGGDKNFHLEPTPLF